MTVSGFLFINSVVFERRDERRVSAIKRLGIFKMQGFCLRLLFLSGSFTGYTPRGQEWSSDL